ncbi:MAG: prepilin-type N-terminal cleavage/methylation domain-containing protein [Candidatus Riflebacteria bacterium]
MGDFRRKTGNRKGVTLFEIVIVAAISSMVLTMAMMIMNRTTRHFKKGTDMLNNQRLMDNIVERIRTDVRSLKKPIPTECNENSFSFMAIRDGVEKKIRYQYDATRQTLFRNEAGKESNFHGAKQVKSFSFKPEFDGNGRFRVLNVVMQLISDDKGGNQDVASTLSIICQFYSTCVEAELDIAKIRKKSKSP